MRDADRELARRADAQRALLPRKPGLARALLARLARPIVVERVPVAFEPGYRAAPARRDGSLSNPHVLQTAGEAGFRFVGVSAFSALAGRILRENWIADDGVVSMSSRRGRASGVEATMSPYYLSTTFDDGSVILTWGQSPPPIASTERLKSRGGTGDIAADLAAHRREVAEKRERSPETSPVIVDSIDDCLAMAAYFEANLTTDSQVRGMLAVILLRWSLRAALVGGLAALIWMLLRRLGM